MRLQRRAHGRVAGNDGVGAGLAGHPGRRPLPDRRRRGDGLRGAPGCPALGLPGPDSITVAATASRTAATSPATIRASQRARPGRGRRVQLSRRRSHSRTVVASTAPQDGSAAGRWPGGGAPALARRGLRPRAAGLRRRLGRARWVGPLLPPERVEELRRQGPDVRLRQAGLIRRTGPRGLPGKPGRHRRPGGVSVPPGQLVRYGRGRAGRFGRPGPVRRKLAGRRREDYLDRRRRPRRRHRCPAAVAGSRWSAPCLTAAHAWLRRPPCPRAVMADRYAIACLCPPGHMEPDHARDPPRDSRTYWDIWLQPE